MPAITNFEDVSDKEITLACPECHDKARVKLLWFFQAINGRGRFRCAVCGAIFVIKIKVERLAGSLTPYAADLAVCACEVPITGGDDIRPICLRCGQPRR